MIPSSFTRTWHQLLARAHRPRPARRCRPSRRLEVEYLEERNLLSVSGTWSQLLAAPPAKTGTMILLSDGTVMAQGGGGDYTSNNLYQLTPDSSGNYSKGTWSSLAAMKPARLYYASNVLPSGNVFIQGGEYTFPGGQNFTNTGTTYNPVTNQWTTNATFPQRHFGDDPSEVLPNGQVLAGYISGPQTYLYNPAKNTWTPAAPKLNNDQSDEETWVKLPNGDILSYSIFASLNTGSSQAQIYNPSGSPTATWSSTGPVPVQLSDSSDDEIGPALLLPNGQVFQIGANGNTALYNYQTNSWTAGPSIPLPQGWNEIGADDAPGAILPDGQVIFAADHPYGNAPTELFDYDYNTNTITQLTGLPTALQNNLNGTPAYPTRMLVLPSGQLLFSSGNYSSNQLWVFTPSDSAQATTWQPTITGVTPPPTGSNLYTLTGTRLNGISEGTSYGDDAETSSNYPIVQLQNQTTRAVSYARTSNWSSTGVSAVGDFTTETVNFTLPAGLPAGTYSVYAIANGISSLASSLTIGSSVAGAAPAARTSTKTGSGSSGGTPSATSNTTTDAFGSAASAPPNAMPADSSAAPAATTAQVTGQGSALPLTAPNVIDTHQTPSTATTAQPVDLPAVQGSLVISTATVALTPTPAAPARVVLLPVVGATAVVSTPVPPAAGSGGRLQELSAIQASLMLSGATVPLTLTPAAPTRVVSLPVVGATAVVPTPVPLAASSGSTFYGGGGEVLDQDDLPADGLPDPIEPAIGVPAAASGAAVPGARRIDAVPTAAVDAVFLQGSSSTGETMREEEMMEGAEAVMLSVAVSDPAGLLESAGVMLGLAFALPGPWRGQSLEAEETGPGTALRSAWNSAATTPRVRGSTPSSAASGRRARRGRSAS